MNVRRLRNALRRSVRGQQGRSRQFAYSTRQRVSRKTRRVLVGLLVAALVGGLLVLSRSRQESDSSLPPNVTVIKGTVVSVTDGDTLTLLDASRTEHKIRLQGIDAPERRQAYGVRAKEALARKVFQKQVQVDSQGQDRYGRTIGNVYLGDRWINRELVAEGWAWHYKQYSVSEDLAQAETNARNSRVGLWQDSHPVPPWEFRHAGGPVDFPE